jgi:hypothetical protein
LDLPQRRGQCDAGGLKNLPADALSLGSEQETIAILLDLDHFQAVKAPDHIGPFKLEALGFKTVFKL